MTAPLTEGDKIIGFIGVDNPRRNTSEFELLRSVTYFIINDLTKRKQLEKLHEMSFMDTMTNVYNRNKYNEVLALYKENPPDTLGTVITDINNLKEANDHFGHQYGDRIIRVMADLLKETFENNIYRIGGDEFALFCPGITREEFEGRLQELRRKLKESRILSASIGSSYCDRDVDASAQMSRSDKQMYIEKEEFHSKCGW